SAGRHEVNQCDGTVISVETGLQNQRVIAVAARAVAYVTGRPDNPAPMLGASEQRGKTGRGVEPRPAEPVDRSGSIDQRRGLTVADQCVIFDAAQTRGSALNFRLDLHA